MGTGWGHRALGRPWWLAALVVPVALTGLVAHVTVRAVTPPVEEITPKEGR